MILAIVGPTAVGKTKASIALSKIYNGEVINADSVQIYKGLDIGSAKVTKQEMSNIPHHLLSIKNVEEEYSVCDYQKDARAKIKEIKSKGHIPIIVGGTGYYIKAALYDLSFSDEEITYNNYVDLSDEELVNKIESYEVAVNDKSNRRRNERLLTKLENGTFSNQDDYKLLYDDVLLIGLTTDRDTLYKRINERFDDIAIDVIDEVKPFYLKGIKSKSLMTGIGYKEFYDFFDNKKTLTETIEIIKQNSRNYAKRQYTYFNNQLDVKWFDVDFDNFQNTINEIVEYIEANKKL
ncbi:MAG: tRNA (adenosine(37)-N6)-dimethylallyltransferase MiaA [Bacilli bacterium]